MLLVQLVQGLYPFLIVLLHKTSNPVREGLELLQRLDLDIEILGARQGVERFVVVPLLNLDLGYLIDRPGYSLLVRIVLDSLLVAYDGLIVVLLLGVDQAFEVQNL